MWKFLLAALLAFMSIIIFFPFLLFLDSTYIFIFVVIGAFIILNYIGLFQDEKDTNTDNTKRSPNINSNNQDIKTTKNTDFVVVVDRKKEDEKLVKNIDSGNTVTDIDGNVYKTVKIGNQIWMAENLRVSRYRNGDIIPNVKNNEDWCDLKNGAWCNYYNDPDCDLEYGKLYNWYAVDDKRSLAPKGWHVASDEEWEELIDYLGGEAIAGRKFKVAGLIHWMNPNKGTSNESGFSAPPCGHRNFNGTFVGLGRYHVWWTATKGSANGAWCRSLDVTQIPVGRNDNGKQNGLSIRCIKDIEPEPVTDIDGNVYKTVQIGTQTWLAENLRVNRYRNGDLIPNVTDDNEWSNLDTGAWCNYENNHEYDTKYGKLYNWYAVDDKRGLAPEGWHVPTDDEWSVLTEYLGGYNLAGGKLKEIGNQNWESWETTNECATNESGFCALPCGGRIFGKYGRFYTIGYNAYWWCSNEYQYRTLYYRDASIIKGREDLKFGFSIRCIKNEADDAFDIVWQNGLCGFKNTVNEKMITKFIYDNATKFHDGLACVFIDSKYGYINKKGEIVVPIIYDVTEYFMGSHDYNFYCGLTEVKQNNKYGFVDKNGVVKIPIIYDSVGYFNERMVSVSTNYKYGYLNNFGEIVVPLIYDFATSFKDGFGEVSLRGKYGFVNILGELIIPCKFKIVKHFGEGYAAVCLNNKFGFTDIEGNMMIPYIFENPYDGSFYEYDNTKYELYVFKNGECLVEFKNKFVAINKSGEVLREVDVTWYVE